MDEKEKTDFAPQREQKGGIKMDKKEKTYSVPPCRGKATWIYKALPSGEVYRYYPRHGEWKKIEMREGGAERELGYQPH